MKEPLSFIQPGGHQRAGEAIRSGLREGGSSQKATGRPQRVVSRTEPSQTCTSKSWERWGQWPGGATWGTPEATHRLAPVVLKAGDMGSGKQPELLKSRPQTTLLWSRSVTCGSSTWETSRGVPPSGISEWRLAHLLSNSSVCLCFHQACAHCHPRTRGMECLPRPDTGTHVLVEWSQSTDLQPPHPAQCPLGLRQEVTATAKWVSWNHSVPFPGCGPVSLP